MRRGRDEQQNSPSPATCSLPLTKSVRCLTSIAIMRIACVAAAGPGANLVMALGWAVLFHLAPLLPSFFEVPLVLMSLAGIRVNLVLMFLNLLPILPLDGGRIVASLLPGRAAWQYAKLEPWGLPVIVLLLMTGTLGTVLRPLVVVSESLLR